METQRNTPRAKRILRNMTLGAVVFIAAVALRISPLQLAFSSSAQSLAPQPPSTTPTYYRDVQPILRQHCLPCHQDNGVAPMSFETYDRVRRYALLISTVAHDKAMPPPFAIPLAGKVTNDPSLTPQQISTLADWADAKAPEGDPHDSPHASDAFPPWNIPRPDLIVKMPHRVAIPAGGLLDYSFQIVPTHFATGRWVQMAEALPSLRANVLQILVVIRRPRSRWLRSAPIGKPFTSAEVTHPDDRRWANDDILAVYAPGSPAQQFPSNTARYVPAHADLVFRVQYTTNGVAGWDQSRVGLVFSKQRPATRVSTLALTNDRFMIPPNAEDYRVEASGVLRQDVTLLSFFPLLHLRGKQFEFIVVHAPSAATGDAQPQVDPLFRVNYDCRWQPVYPLADPLLLRAGTELRAIATYDNSPANPLNPDPSATVHWGERPQDEVLEGFFDVLAPATVGWPNLLAQHR
jgi:hypothetical protein